MYSWQYIFFPKPHSFSSTVQTKAVQLKYWTNSVIVHASESVQISQVYMYIEDLIYDLNMSDGIKAITQLGPNVEHSLCPSNCRWAEVHILCKVIWTWKLQTFTSLFSSLVFSRHDIAKILPPWQYLFIHPFLFSSCLILNSSVSDMPLGNLRARHRVYHTYTQIYAITTILISNLVAQVLNNRLCNYTWCGAWHVLRNVL